MNNKAKTRFKQRLADDLTTSREQLDSVEQQLADPDNVSKTETGDISVAADRRTRLLNERARLQAKIRRIVRAQRHFDDEFGYCVECGVDIPTGRLEFDPSIQTCVDCQERAEVPQRAAGMR